MTAEEKINKRKIDWILSPRTEFGFRAEDLSYVESTSYIIPNQIRDDIPTLNKFGYMKADICGYGYDFIDYASNIEDMVLELGTAYGQVVLEALNRGANIIANDISTEHLEILLENASDKYLDKLFLYPGKFSDEIDFSENSLGAIYTARMIHFLSGDEVIKGLKKIHNWLKRDGKLYFISVTPHHLAFRERFLPIYNDRVIRGEEWPGRIENHWEIAPQHEEFVPNFIQTFDIPQLEQLLPKFGLEIEKISLFDYPNDICSDGVGHVGLVARKV
ncbi:MAG: class I SAM-dependent methyltransferase [Janthinobacterium lividum]